MRRISVVCIMLTLLCLLAPLQVVRAQAGVEPSATPKPASAITPVAMIEIRNLDDLTKKIDKDIAPLVPSMKPGLLWDQLESLAGTGTLSGVDRSGRMAIAVFDPAAFSPPVVLAVSVSSADAFLSGLETSLKKGEKQGDIYTYYKEKTTFDIAAFKNATAEERKNLEKFQTVERVTVFVLISGRFAIISKSPELINAVAARQEVLERGLDVSEWVKDSDILATVNMDEFMRIIQPKIDQMMMFMAMASQMAQGSAAAPGVNPQQVGQILAAEVNVFKQLAAQTKGLDLGFKLDQGQAILRESIAMRPQTPMADFFSKQKARKPAFAAYAPDNAALVGWAAIDDWSPLMPLMQSTSADMMKAMGIDAEKAKEMLELQKVQFGAMGGELVFAMYPGSQGGMGVSGATGLRDPKAAEENVAKSMQASLPFMSGMGMGIELEQLSPEPYKGVKLQGFRMKFAAEGMPAGTTQMIEQMYGGAPATYSGVLGDKELTSFGADADSMIKRTIDAVSAGKSLGFDGTAEYKKVVAALPRDGAVSGLFIISLPGLRNFIASMPGAPGGMIPPFPEAALYTYVTFSAEGANAQVTVPLAEILKAIKEAAATPAPAK